MKSHLTTALSSFLFVSLFSSCNSIESKSSGVTTNFAMTGSGQTALVQTNLQKAFSFVVPSAVALTPPALEDSNGVAVSLSEAWIVVKKIQFKSSETAENGEASDESSNYKGPFFVDLLSNSPTPFGDIQVPASGLRRVKMLLHKSGSELPASAPAALANKSIYLSGSVNGHTFSYSADDTTDFVISGPNPIVPEEERNLLAVIRVADLFKKINLSGITSATVISSTSRFPATNPCPEIHASANDLYTCFVKGLASEAKFGKDDGDMDLEPSDESVDQ